MARLHIGFALLAWGCTSADTAGPNLTKEPSAPLAPAPSGAPAPRGPSHRYVTGSMRDPRLAPRLAEHARAAARLGLRPVVFVRTTWNAAVTLPSLRPRAEVREALRGWYVIDLEFDGDCLETDCHHPVFDQVMCGTWGPSFHPLDDRGHPGRPIHGGSKGGMGSLIGTLRVLESVRDVLTAHDRGDEIAPCASGG